MMRLLLVLVALGIAAPAAAQVPTVGCNPPGVLVQPSGEVYSCLAAPGTWALLRPTNIAVSGSTLPTSCVVGAMFTLTPAGSLWTCATPNVFVPVGGTAVIKTLTGIPNNTFVDALTVTVPNTGTAALIEVLIVGSLGAGGSVGAFEATAGRTVLINVTRTPGLSLDASIVTTANATDAKVVGATTITQTTQLSAVSGAPTGTQTVTLQYRIARGAGASTNHSAALVSRITSSTPILVSVQ